MSCHLNYFCFSLIKTCACRVDDLIDVIHGNRVYIPCLYVYNKIDQICMEEVDRCVFVTAYSMRSIHVPLCSCFFEKYSCS